MLLKFKAKPNFDAEIPPLPFYSDEVMVSRERDVGLTLLTYDDNSDGLRVTGWSLIFPLKYFNHPAYASQRKEITPAFLLGEVSNPMGMDCINRRISRSQASTWGDLTFTLASDFDS